MSDWRIDYSDEAQDDLAEIYSYIAYTLLSRDNADGQVERIMEAVEKLDHMPLRYKVYPDEPWHRLGLRQMNVDHFAVLYYPNEISRVVGIVRIMYNPSDKSTRLLKGSM